MRMIPSEFRKFRAASCLFAVLTLSVSFGCSRSASTPKSNDFFVTWLQGHGESNVVVDARALSENPFTGSPFSADTLDQDRLREPPLEGNAVRCHTRQHGQSGADGSRQRAALA